ncbi:unnamed protein product [Adineta ricciae]|uniref:NAD-dependent epimerase/dehydratase domain-containing protein n=1 Tax=Adineta ricciae TaxID=249248 RepID=A0A814V989_ADIRI|nr:unnamed protein product [Adineta ricciae]
MMNQQHLCLLLLVTCIVVGTLFYIKQPTSYRHILRQYRKIVISHLQSNTYLESFLSTDQYVLHDGSDCIYYDNKNGLFHPNTKHPRFIVTGGAGFIGSHLVKRLTQQYNPSQIKVLDNLSHGRLHNLQYADGTWSISTTRDFCLVDLRNVHVALKYVTGADVVFHLAKVFSTSNRSSALYETSLVKVNVMYAMKLNTIANLVFAEGGWPTKLNSSVPLSEKLKQYENDLVHSHEFNIGVVRLESVYGPNCDYTDLNEQIVGWLIAKGLSADKDSLTRWSVREEHRDLIYVDDAVDGLMLVYEEGMNKGVLDVRSDRRTSTKELVQMIGNVSEEKLGRRVTGSYEFTSGESDEESYGDGKNILRWRPKVKLEDGIWRTMTWIGENQNKPRVLVITLGQLRGGPLAWKSLHKFLLKPYNAHLALHISDFTSRTYLHDIAQYIWMEEEHKDWGVVLQLVSETCGNEGIVGKWREYCNIPGLFMGGVANCNHRSHTSVSFAFRWMLQQKISKLQLLDKYDWFILTRADELHLCEHFDFTTMTESDILLPTDEHYNGWSDRHLIARSSMFMKMINITNELICRPDYWRNKLEGVDYELNIEVVQKLIWDDMGLTVSEHPRSIFIVRSSGDPASWSRGRSHPELSRFNLKVKYPRELKSSKIYCKTRNITHMMESIREYN